MRPKSIVLLILALGCGLVASIGINQVLASRRAATGTTGGMTKIFVAVKDIGIGDPVTAELVKLEEWPENKVPAGAVTKLQQLEDRRARVRFFPGEPILEAKLLPKGEEMSSASDVVPKGMRVVAVRVDAQSSGGYLLLPGDRVDVMVHLAANANVSVTETLTRTILQNVKVFAVDDIFNREKDGKNTIAAKTVSLLVTPKQAELLTLARSIGEIQLSIRNAEDSSVTETEGATLHELLGTAPPERPSEPSSSGGLLSMLTQAPPAPPQPAAQPEPKTSEPEPEPQPVFTMLIVSGNQPTTVTFDAEDGPPVFSGPAPASGGDGQLVLPDEAAPGANAVPGDAAGEEPAGAPADGAGPSARRSGQERQAREPTRHTR
jgi:pilus assembly protein CpaB